MHANQPGLKRNHFGIIVLSNHLWSSCWHNFSRYSVCNKLWLGTDDTKQV